MRLKILFVFVISNLLILSIFSQKSKDTFSENLKMNLLYQWGFLSLTSGEMEFRQIKTIVNNKPVILLEAHGNTLKSFDFIYSYSSSLHTQVDQKTMQLLHFKRTVNHNGKNFAETYKFDHSQKQIYCNILDEKNVKTTDTIKIEEGINDFLSAFRHVRHLKYELMKAGQKVPVKILLEKKVHTLNISYVGIENVILPDKNKYTCYKINIEVIEGSVFRDKNALSAWISADSQRLPVQIKAEILVGSLNAFLATNNNATPVLSAND